MHYKSKTVVFVFSGLEILQKKQKTKRKKCKIIITTYYTTVNKPTNQTVNITLRHNVLLTLKHNKRKERKKEMKRKEVAA